MIDVNKISAYLKIADAAIEHQRTKNETSEKRRIYHSAWKAFELGDEYDPEDDNDYSFYVHSEERIHSNHQMFGEACEATKQYHEAYKAAKRVEYNAKRRLETAIRGIK